MFYEICKIFETFYFIFPIIFTDPLYEQISLPYNIDQ
jgi:hypothetical protein